MSVQKRNISQITGLRGIIAFLIAYVLHWMLLFWAIPDFNNEFIEQAFGASATAILYSPNVFFIFSGYLIHKSYHERLTNEEISFADFMIPKMKKIYPIVITTAFITWMLQNLGLYMFGVYPLHQDGGTVRNSVVSLLLSVLGLQSGYFSDNDAMSVNGPAWFVAILFLCYVIYYFITRLIHCKWGQNLCYVGLIILGIFIICVSPNLPLLYMVNGRGYFSFFAGVMIREVIELMEDPDEEDSYNILKIFTYIIAIVCFIYSGYECIIKANYAHRDILILTIFFWPSLVYLTLHGYVLKWIFSFPVFVFLGKMAMPIFLCNFPTNVAIRMCDMHFGWNLDYTNPWLWFAHIILSLLIVFIFHIIFEVSWKKIA